MRSYVKDGYPVAVDIDLAKFFDTARHDLLMSLLGRTIGDKQLLALIGRYLRAGVLVGGHIEPSEVGTPQGGPLSLIVLVKSKRAGERVMGSLTRYLERTLKFDVNLAKSKVALMSECSFLGFTIKGKKIRRTEKSEANFKHRIKELTGRSWGVSMAYRLHKLGQYLRGWVGYFGISQYYQPVSELDEWIRRRIRMCYWKRWRWPRTKIKNLLALGVSLKSAIQHGVSSLSYWHMARTPVTQQALNNTWLAAQGLLNVKDLWCKAKGYTSKKTSSCKPTC